MRICWAITVCMLLVAACSRDTVRCHADESAGCTCADGSYGYAACLADGSGFGACGSCGITPGVDAASIVDGGDEAGLPLYAACTTDAECASGMCYAYTAKGFHCTHACGADTDCAPPSPQCTPKGVCKLP